MAYLGFTFTGKFINMALIQVGSINSFAVAAAPRAIQQQPTLRGVRSFSELNEVTSAAPPDAFDLITSVAERGVGIKSIQLTEGFEGFLQQVFNPVNEIYFVAWAWDLSGQPVERYPGDGVRPEDMIFKIRTGKLREFIGEGINLFPKRKVKGGIAMRIQVWESDADIRTFGKVMTETADTIRNSKLNNVISLVSAATGITGATITLIKEAALELTDSIGKILQANANDYVDLFEGYYAADQDWNTGLDTYTGNASVLALNKY